MKINVVVPAVLALFLFSCKQDYTPRGRDFPVMQIPEDHSYLGYENPECPFSFEYNRLAQIERDTQLLENQPENECWLNIVYPRYNATIYLSYKTPEEDYNLLKLKNEAHKLTYEHAKRANFIEPKIMTAPGDIYAVIYNVGGAAASPTQFYVTDTVRHWLRGALYFKTSPNPDSLRPLIQYVDEDIDHLIRSIRWK